MRLRVIALAVLCLAACKKDGDPRREKPETPAAPAAKDDARPDPKPDRDTLAKPFLWSAKKGTNTTYLLGTMHLGVDPARLPPSVWKKLDEARAFAMESNPTDPALQRFGHRSGGSLRDDLGPAYHAKLEKVLGADLVAQIDAYQPVKAAMILGVRALPETPPMDHELWRRARTAGKRVTYLEAAAMQVAMLERLFDVRMLKYMIDDADNNAKGQRELLAAYLAGDTERLLAAGKSERAAALAHGFSDTEYDAMIEELMYARNQAWIVRIEELHADGIAFVAVGAMHLVGSRSVLELLQKRGFEVARVLN